MKYFYTIPIFGENKLSIDVIKKKISNLQLNIIFICVNKDNCELKIVFDKELTNEQEKRIFDIINFNINEIKLF